MGRNMYFSDATIIPRVQKYLETNSDNQYIDINVMAEEIQRKYPREYGKRKRSAFRALIKKAYTMLIHDYSQRNSSDSEEVSEDINEDDTINYGDNSMNNQIMEMYSRNNVPKPLDENELIDISSDDSQDNDSHKSNGPSTSSNSQVQPHFLDGFLPKIGSNEVNVFKVADDQPDPVINTSDRGKKRKPDASSTPSAKKKKASVAANLEESKVSFKDLGGLEKTLTNVCKLLVLIKHPEVYRQIGSSPPRGFLLHGPPGCGKTLLANAIAGELERPLLTVAAPELVAGVSGESEERIRELFERAAVSAPCVLFIDELDAITPNRQFAQKYMERRIVSQLLTCIDDLNKNESGDQVLVIAATNRPDSLDPALRRSGRFDREVCLGIPDSDARLHILKVLTSKLKLEDNFDFSSLAEFTPGFVGADLMALTREAVMTAVNRVCTDLREKQKLEQAMPLQSTVDSQENGSNDTESKSDAEIVVDDENKSDLADVAVVVSDDDSKTVVDKVVAQQSNIINSIHLEMKKMTHLEELLNWLHTASPLTSDQLDNVYVNSEDFAEALKCVQPSAKREGFATVPDVTWEDIGSLKNIREELQLAIFAQVRHRKEYESLGLNTPTGVLLCGPPGCGKTLLAKAIANEAGINFISVKGPELMNMYVGESERAVRLCFERARNSSPCVIFFDELDALCPKRSDSGEGGAAMRVVNQMLTEMDGVEGREGVYLLAASNRPEVVDPAILRPGRLDKILYVGFPSPDERVDILRAITKNGTRPVLAHDVDLEQIGKSDRCEGYTGADLAAIVKEAGVQALREVRMQGDMQKTFLVTTDHFTKAISKIRPSISYEDQLKYERMKKIYTAKPDGTRPDVDLEQIGKCDRCEGYTGSDLAALVREAGVQALREVMMQGDIQKTILVTDHITKAIGIVDAADKKGFTVVMKKPKKINKPRESLAQVTMKAGPRRSQHKLRRLMKFGKYRTDLTKAALRRASAILKSQKPIVNKKKQKQVKKTE